MGKNKDWTDVLVNLAIEVVNTPEAGTVKFDYHDIVGLIEQEKQKSYEQGFYEGRRETGDNSLSYMVGTKRSYEEGYERAKKDMAEGKLPVEFRH